MDRGNSAFSASCSTSFSAVLSPGTVVIILSLGSRYFAAFQMFSAFSRNPLQCCSFRSLIFVWYFCRSPLAVFSNSGCGYPCRRALSHWFLAWLYSSRSAVSSRVHHRLQYGDGFAGEQLDARPVTLPPSSVATGALAPRSQLSSAACYADG